MTNGLKVRLNDMEDKKEIWKPIKGFEGRYEVSNMGRVMSLCYKNTNQKKVMSPSPNLQGYFNLALRKNGKLKRVLVNRLVAETFIPNPENKPQVNHINGCHQDNRVENLEWVTAKENMQHAFHVLKRKANTPQLGRFGILDPASKSVRMMSKDGKELRVFGCIRDAEREMNIRSANITASCRGKRPSAGGFKWEYV